jgi:hypothetical protein
MHARPPLAAGTLGRAARLAMAAVVLHVAPAWAQGSAPGAGLPRLQPLPAALAPAPVNPPDAARPLSCPSSMTEGVVGGALAGAFVGWVFSYGLIALTGSRDEPVQRARRSMIVGMAGVGAAQGAVAARRCEGRGAAEIVPSPVDSNRRMQ